MSGHPENVGDQILVWTPPDSSLSLRLPPFPCPLPSLPLPGALTLRPEHFLSYLYREPFPGSGFEVEPGDSSSHSRLLVHGQTPHHSFLLSYDSVASPWVGAAEGTPCPPPPAPLQCEGFGVCVFTSWLFCQAPSSLQCSPAGSAKDSAHCGFLPGISNKARGRGGQSHPLCSAATCWN